MFWADIIAKNLKDTGPHLVNDAKTPSGKVHVGALRGVLIHDFVHKALLELKVKSHYTFHFDDTDPMDGLPVNLDQKKYQEYMGRPLNDIPAPEGSGSYAEYYANDFLKVFNQLGAKPEIIWSSTLYKNGTFDRAIKTVLDNADKIQEIYHQVSGSEKQKGWLPFQPICPNCHKIGTTHSSDWDGKEVRFTCEKDLVTWAKGCGYSGKISPFGGTGKMPYKVEWPAKWFSLGITIEGEGKDHFSKGGTRDVSNTIMRQIFQKEPPADIPYEHILFGGKKMSSSKGLGSSAADVAEILPPEILRFLFARVPYQRAIDFDPSLPNTIPDLFDEFDRGQKAFFEKNNPDLAKTWEASQIGEIKEEFNLRFNLIKEFVSNLLSDEAILVEAEKIKGEKLEEIDDKAIRNRLKYVRIWLKNLAPNSEKTQVLAGGKGYEFTKKQVELLLKIAEVLEKEEKNEDELQNFIFQTSSNLGLQPKEGFQAVYQALLGQDQGPKAGKLLLFLDKTEVSTKLNQFSK